MAREPWVEKLDQNEGEAAWDLLIEQYHRLISATVRHYGRGYDDVMDLFAFVCTSLRAKDFARLRKYAAIPEGRVRFTTWLVAVIRNLAIDWLRQRDGRKGVSEAVSNLPPTQRAAFEAVFREGYSPAEAYELTRTRGTHDLPFREFLKELIQAQEMVSRKDPGRLFKETRPVMVPEAAAPVPSLHGTAVKPSPERADSRTIHAELREWLRRALGCLSAEDRAAVRLYLMDELPAADVARLMGWEQAKTVYNRVYRSLQAMREYLSEEGVDPDDLR